MRERESECVSEKDHCEKYEKYIEHIIIKYTALLLPVDILQAAFGVR
jgi:hypothetical protein